jgi:hypothetical protein
MYRPKGLLAYATAGARWRVGAFIAVSAASATLVYGDRKTATLVNAASGVSPPATPLWRLQARRSA